MKSISTLREFESAFGKHATNARQLCTETYRMFRFTEDSVYFDFDLQAIFKEPIELFSVDPTLTTDMFTINDLFTNELIDPDIVTCLFDYLDKILDYDPITMSGELWLTFQDIRTFYGEDEFDKEMNQLFENDYPNVKEYFVE